MMTVELRNQRVSWGLAVVLLVVLVLAGVSAWALPKDLPSRPSFKPAHDREVLLAQRRRHRRPPKAKPKAQPKAQPKAARPEPEPQPSGPAEGGAGPADPGNLQRGGRVEFDGRLVQGQSAKSGAIYLFARQRTDLKSMVRERENYRKEILRTVYSDWAK